MIFSATTIGLTPIPVTIRAVLTPDTRTRRTWIGSLHIADENHQAPVIARRLAAILDRAAAGQPNLGCRGRVTVSLEPSSPAKTLCGLELPILLSIMETQFDGRFQPQHEYAWFGNIGLDESLTRVDNLLSSTEACVKKTVIVPSANSAEAGLIRRPCLLADDLAEIVRFVHSGTALRKPRVCLDSLEDKSTLDDGRRLGKFGSKPQSTEGQIMTPCAIDMMRILGNKIAKRAAEIAAAAGLSLLTIGSPGVGKTMLGRAFAGILPPMTDDERYEVTRIQASAGLLPPGQLASDRPFRPVHHSVSMQALVGGGSAGKISPGEVSLAHRGVLFLDEAPEFTRNALDALRQPVEAGVVHISRVGVQTILPASFALLAAANPCRCGYAGTYWCLTCRSWSLTRICHCGAVAQDKCRCSPMEARRYQARLSGPLLDRVDMRVRMLPLSSEDRSASPGDSSSAVQARVIAARDRMASRLQPLGVRTNATIPPGQTMTSCQFATSGLDAYEQVLRDEPMSNRRADRLLRVAQTIADLDGGAVTADAVTEARSFVVG